MKWNTYPLFLMALLSPLFLHAQRPDTVRLEDHRLHLHSLKPGTHRYLVYNENEQGQRSNVWIWERIVSTAAAGQTDSKPGASPDFFVVKQHWFGSDSLQTERALTSICRWQDFAPLYHYSQFTNIQQTLTEAYNFRADSVVTSDTVKTDRPHFAQALTTPTFNWELDLELFPLLPLKDGKTMVLNLYHPGAALAPSYFTYTVKGKDDLVLYNGRKAHCWVLSIDYGKGNYAVWWIDKKKRIVWRMKEYFNGQYRFKVLMTS